MKSKRRTQANRTAATRQALVVAARALFAARGYGEVGTEAIVEAARVSRGALYHHFADKVELFAAVFEAVEAEALERIAAALTASKLTDPVDLMRLGAATWLEVCSDPEIHRIALIEAPAVLGWRRWREISTRYGIGMTQRMLTHAMAADQVPQQPVEPLAHVLLGALREAALFLADAQDPARARRDVSAVLDGMIRSLGRAP
jgi:AcrR family transcriptional regulator